MCRYMQLLGLAPLPGAAAAAAGLQAEGSAVPDAQQQQQAGAAVKLEQAYGNHAVTMEVDGAQQQQQQQQPQQPQQPQQSNDLQGQPIPAAAPAAALGGLPPDVAAAFAAAAAVPSSSEGLLGRSATLGTELSSLPAASGATGTGTELSGGGEEDGEGAASRKPMPSAVAATQLPASAIPLAPRLLDSKREELRAHWEALRKRVEVCAVLGAAGAGRGCSCDKSQPVCTPGAEEATP